MSISLTYRRHLWPMVVIVVRVLVFLIVLRTLLAFLGMGYDVVVAAIALLATAAAAHAAACIAGDLSDCKVVE